jgi:hypothetical protein
MERRIPEQQPKATDVAPPAPLTHARSADFAPVPSRGGPRHEIGAKNTTGAGQRSFNESMVRSPAPDVRPGFVSGAGSRRPLMAETRVDEEYQNPAEKRIPFFAKQ